MKSFPIEDYQIGIISALPKELTAVIAILDEEHEQLRTKDAQDHNSYVLGQIDKHNVVAACLPTGVYGTNTAASVSTNILRTFPHLKFGLFVGIGGGIPNVQAGRDIRLGDIVVSQPDQTHNGVVQYDFGQRLSNGRFRRGRELNRPPTTLLTALSTLQSRQALDGNPIPKHLKAIDQKHSSLKEHGYCFPGHDHDQLCCTKCDPSQWWWTLWLLVLWFWPLWRCQRCDDSSGRVRRPLRTNADPMIHYGTIASGNTLLKDARMRDQLRDDLGALCIEMEAAGVVEQFPCLVIRGVCDYADASKNDVWQEYAALTAAAFAKHLLGYVSPLATKLETPIVDILSKLDQRLQQQEEHQQLQEAFNHRQEIRYHNERHQHCHRIFDTSSSKYGGYENHKDVNPEAVLGTCRWVLDHPRYRSWSSSTRNDLLWISANPGCGKSVLSRALIENYLRDPQHGSPPSICYFFFKDNEQQNNLAIALCAVIHQLFSQQPHLISHALPAFDKSGEKLQYKVNDLWRILGSAAGDMHAGPIICVLDALDECRDGDRAQLIQFLCSFYSSSCLGITKDRPFKWLVTSRPYDDVRDNFGQISTELPSIRLSGEEESDQIRWEINIVIQERMRELSRELQLSSTKADEVTQQLLGMEHRTYLWLHLAIDAIKKSFREALRPADQVIPLVPASVEDAYEGILRRIDSAQKRQAMAVLTIIVGARRPLTINEMAIALDVATLIEPPTSLADLSVDATQLADRIRGWCGLFVLIIDKRLYLLHQTAKEFLMHRGNGSPASPGNWKFCLSPLKVEQDMAVLCIRFLCMSDFEDTRLSVPTRGKKSHLFIDAPKDQGSRSGVRTFFKFALRHWGDHTRPVERYLDENTKEVMQTLYNTHNQRYAWWKYVNKLEHTLSARFIKSNTHLAAFHGHSLSLSHFLQRACEQVDLSDREVSTSLFIASARGFSDTVQMLLHKGANVNAVEETYGWTSLIRASEEGHLEVVQTLLDAGADVNFADKHGRTSLMWAAEQDHLEIVQALLDVGADVNAADKDGWTSLMWVSEQGHLEIVQALLNAGADVNAAQEEDDETSLIMASYQGHLEIVQALLDAGADVNATKRAGWTSLMHASLRGHLEIVQALLGAGADVNAAAGENGWTSLMWVAEQGHLEIVQALLGAGADVNAAQEEDDETSLIMASYQGHLEVVQALLDAGADVNATEKDGRTSLTWASDHGHVEVVQTLINAGADVHALTRRRESALHAAPKWDCRGVEQLLLQHGARFAEEKEIEEGGEAEEDSESAGVSEVGEIAMD